MGLPVEVNNLMLGSLGGYTVGRSLRFRSSASAYLNRTPASAGNRRTWTWSGWVKRGTLSSAQWVFDAFQDASNFTAFFFNSDNTFGIQYVLAGTSKVLKYTTQVFRDPSAWYHIMVVTDTTPATPTFTVYVNGSQVTAFGTNTNTVSQNEQLFVNNTVAHNVGRYGGSANYFDGYLAEVNFIDGQALTPSSFGAYDTNGVWQPKKYTGTYGTNGFYLPFNTNTAYGAAISGTGSTVNVNGSYTNLTLGTGDFTVEGWVYLNSTGSVGVIDWRPTSTNGNYPTIYISSGTLYYYVNSANVITSGTTIPTQTWTHIAVARSGTTTKMFINGTQTGSSWSDSTNYLGATNRPGFGGAGFNGTSNGFDGYFSNLRIVKGTAVYTANFTPSTSPLTAITNTSLLTFNSATITDNSGNSVALTVGGTSSAVQFAPFGYNINSDQSGNGNNWNLNNISLINGTTYDSMIDSPTNAAGASTGIGNYAVLNAVKLTDPGATATAEISQGNLAVINTRAANNVEYVVSTIGVTSGKWYYEATMGGNPSPGLQWIGINTSDYGSGSSIRGYRNDNGQYYNGSAWSAYGASYVSGDVIGIAFDLDSQTIEFFKNGTSQGQKTSIGLSGIVMHAAAAITQGSGAFYFNFGQRPFSYTPPLGFKALNTYNLPAPSIANGAQYMAATVFSASGSSQTVTNTVNNASFQTDFLWLKNRTSAGNHYLADVIRGPSNLLYSDATSAEGSAPSFITSFNSNGFTINTNGVYTNGNSIIGWQWKGGGTAVTNNSGTITSTVSASPSSGFSIATYSGNGTNGATVGHGLGVKPDMIIIKGRNASTGSSQWICQHVSLSGGVTANSSTFTLSGYTQTIYLNLTNAAASYAFDAQVNGASGTYVAYCFSAVSGYSAFGKYTGNGSADGPFIYTGFRPRWVMIKNTQDGTTNWYIYDTSRDTYNIMSNYLMSNLSNAEASFSAMDYLSNGFKIRTSNLNFNNSGQTHIYAAFAESPFQISRAR